MQATPDTFEVEFELHLHCEELERALAFARSKAPDEALSFIRLWRARDWQALRHEHPEFPIQLIEEDAF